MNETINVGKRVKTVDVAPEFAGVTKLICNIDDETVLTAGDDSGYAIEFDNPLMTQTVLNAMLAKIRGYQYAPLKADGALLDPSAEIGDGISANGAFSAVFNRKRAFGRLMSANVEAPADEEIDHEYQYVAPEQRKYKRDMGNVRATLLIQSDRISAEVEERTAQGQTFSSQLALHSTEIAAKVNATGGNNSSFGWTLNATGHTWYAGSQQVMKVTASGLEVKGKITATSGYIGNGTSGFTISNTAIYNNISSFGGTQSTGVYVGTNGIQLGNKFKVISSGDVTASSLTITGGSININNKFKVTSAGVLTADLTSGSISLGRDSSNNPIFQVTSGGAVTARSLTLIGGSINIADKFRVTSGGAVTATNLTITGGSINIADKFRVDSNGNVSITSGSMNIANAFRVTSTGAVTATNLTITGGSISIGSNFRVDSQGNLTANTGTFLGAVNAGNIRYGGNYGTLSGGGISSGSIGLGSGSALSGAALSGISWGGNFGSMTQQAYTADWVVANHIVCYSGGNISGTHYGLWADDSQTHGVSWKSKDVLTGGSVSVGFGNVFQVLDVNGNRQWAGNSLWADFNEGGSSTIDYLGR